MNVLYVITMLKVPTTEETASGMRLLHGDTELASNAVVRVMR